MESIIPSSLPSIKVDLTLDVETIIESVNRTDRLFIVHEAGMTVSVGRSQKKWKQETFLKARRSKELLAGSELCPSIFILDANISNSVALEYEKIHVPDSIRVLDAIIGKYWNDNLDSIVPASCDASSKGSRARARGSWTVGGRIGLAWLWAWGWAAKEVANLVD